MNKIINAISLLFPPVLAILGLFAIAPTLGITTSFTEILLSAILGFSLSFWILVWGTSERVKSIIESFRKNRPFQIRLIHSEKELEHIVKSLYYNPHAVIYAASINYTPRDINISDARTSDWASDLYSKSGVSIQYNRIVSVQNDRDKQWVKNMIQGKKNQNYDLRVLEGVPQPLLYPNFVVIKSDNAYTLFMSYRANAASGRFAFSTSNQQLAEGIWNYASGFHASLPRAEEYLEANP